MKNIPQTLLVLLLALLVAVGCKAKEERADDAPSADVEQRDAAAVEEKTAADKASAPDEQRDSIYVSDDVWTDHNNNEVTLRDFEGKPALVAMIFTHCGHACPMMVSNMLEAQNTLPRELREKTQFILITFNSEGDTPDVLNKYADNHGLDSQWTLLHGDEEKVRTMSMLLGVQYALLDNGHYSHSNILTVLDHDGGIVETFEGLESQTNAIVEAVRRADR